MNVQVLLDSPPGGVFTNLDSVSGKVVLRVLYRTSSVSQILVKLEGESNAVLKEFDIDTDRNNQTCTEKHRILYKVERVFPTASALAAELRPKEWFFQPGVYEYPFTFKLPINNTCELNTQHVGVMGGLLAGIGGHVKTTLPPSFSFKKMAGVYYYVKCTVSIPKLFRENPRVAKFFNFCPIEPPRPRGNGECYARREHAFLETDLASARRKPKNSLFRKDSLTPLAESSALPPVGVTLDARLPNPAILTCAARIPLRLLLTIQAARSRSIYLQNLQIEIIGRTDIRASHLEQHENMSWVLVSKSNLHMEIGSKNDAAGTVCEISDALWDSVRVPESVCPSFRSCNIERTYRIAIMVALTYGSHQEQFVSLPLRHQIKIFSGIAPPPALLHRIDSAIESSADAVARPAGETVGGRQQNSAITTSVEDAPLQNEYFDAPPSYQEATAEDVPPLESGPRIGYRPPLEPNMTEVLGGNSK